MKKTAKILSQIFGKNIYKNIRYILPMFIIILLAFDLSCATKNPKKEKEKKEYFQGVWIATVFNIDFPSRPNLSIDIQKKELTDMLDAMQKAGINNIIFQVKPAQEAFYKSALLPYSQFITGLYTNALAYDPLSFAVEETHKRGMKIHAWFNPYRVLDYNAFTNYAKTAKKEWLVKYDKYHYLDPGIPEVKDFVIGTIMEVVTNYDIDGVHLDDYFYPYSVKKETFNDDETYKKYGFYFKTKEEFRRSSVNAFIYELNKTIKLAKPDIVFGVSPFAIWRNKSDDKKGSDTTAVQTSYDNLFADTRLWFLEGMVDYIAPQIYFDNTNERAKFSVVLQWWEKLSRKTKTPLYVGMPAYKAADAKYTMTNFISNYNIVKESSKVDGMIYFSAKHIVSNLDNLSEFLYTNSLDIDKSYSKKK